MSRAYCQAIADNSQPSWEDAPDWQRDSAMNGVEFHQDNPNMTPEQSHDNWLAEKARDGWSYGPEKDPDNKKHPCFMPYESLPNEQKVKDYLFRAVVHSLSNT